MEKYLSISMYKKELEFIEYLKQDSKYIENMYNTSESLESIQVPENLVAIGNNNEGSTILYIEYGSALVKPFEYMEKKRTNSMIWGRSKFCGNGVYLFEITLNKGEIVKVELFNTNNSLLYDSKVSKGITKFTKSYGKLLNDNLNRVNAVQTLLMEDFHSEITKEFFTKFIKVSKMPLNEV